MTNPFGRAIVGALVAWLIKLFFTVLLMVLPMVFYYQLDLMSKDTAFWATQAAFDLWARPLWNILACSIGAIVGWLTCPK